MFRCFFRQTILGLCRLYEWLVYRTDTVEQSLKASNIEAKMKPTPIFESMMSGANEKQIVNSGLEYSMTKACQVCNDQL